MKNYIIVLLSLFCLSLNAMNEVEEMPLREVRMEEIAEPKIHHKAVMGMVLEDSATKLEEMPQRVILVEDLSGSLIQETSKDKGRRTCIELLDDLLSMVDIDNKTRIETARTIISEYTGGDNKLFNDFKNKLNKDAFSYKIDPETVATSAAAYKYIDNNLKGKRSPGNSRNSMRESQSGFQKGFIEKQEGFGRSSVSEEIDKQPFFSIDGEEDKDNIHRKGYSIYWLTPGVVDSFVKSGKMSYSQGNAIKESLETGEKISKGIMKSFTDLQVIREEHYDERSGLKIRYGYIKSKESTTKPSFNEDIVSPVRQEEDKKYRKIKKYGAVSMPTMSTEKKS